MASTPKENIASSLTSDLVKIYVGRKRKRYQVHADLLTPYPYFKAKLQLYHSNPHLSYSNIYIDDLDATFFDLLINWLYRQVLHPISLNDEELAKQQATNYIHLYLSAIIWGIPALQNAIMDVLRARPTCITGWSPHELIRRICRSTNTGSKLRSYIVDTFVMKSYFWVRDGERKDELRMLLEAGNQEFVLECYEALVGFVARSNVGDPNRKKGCVYHEHEDGRTCKG